MARRIVKKKKEFKHEGITLTVVSDRDIDQERQMGSIHAIGDEVKFEAKNIDYAHGPVKWVCVGKNQRHRVRVTHNIQTGEYRIAKTFTLADVNTLTRRDISEIESLIGDMISNYIMK